MKLFDKPEVLTVSGIHRGEQRRLYDARKAELIPVNGLRMIVLRKAQFRVQRKHIAPSYRRDMEIVRRVLDAYIQ